MTVTAVAVGEVLVAGNDYQLVITLTKDSATFDITGATITCSIRRDGRNDAILSNLSLVITTAVSGICTLTLTDLQTASLAVPALSHPLETITHLGDIKVVETTLNVLNSEPFTFEVRRPIT